MGLTVKQEAPEPRISSSSAAGEPPGGFPLGGGAAAAGGAGAGGGLGLSPQHGLDDASMKAEAGADSSMFAFPGSGAAPSGSPRLGPGGGMFGGGMGGGMVPVAMAGLPAILGTAQQLSGTSSLGAPSPLGGPSGDDGGSSSGSMPPRPPGAMPLGVGAAVAAAAEHHAAVAFAAAPHENGGAAAAAGLPGLPGQVFRSDYRGVSYDKKKRKWRVQIKVAALGKSGVSVGYFDTELAAARAYDRAAIGLLGRGNCRTILNFPMEDYENDAVPELVGAPAGLLLLFFCFAAGVEGRGRCHTGGELLAAVQHQHDQTRKPFVITTTITNQPQQARRARRSRRRSRASAPSCRGGG